MNEKQKPVNDKYRKNWDDIFKKKDQKQELAQFKFYNYGFDTKKGGFYVEENDSI